MRLVIATLIVLLPALADAQSRRARPIEPPPDPPQATLPPIGLPLPQIGLPLPPIGMAPPGTRTESTPPRHPDRQRPRPPHRRGPRRPDVVYVVPAYPYGWGVPGQVGGSATPAASTAEPAELPPEPTGTLWLDIEPRGIAEVYVDGYFMGTADERRGELSLEPGPHRVELKAQGYESERVDVRAEAGATVTLRRTLKPASGPPAATPAPAAPIARKPFYMIPGCYLGDVPPKDAGLPANCDLSKTVIVPPSQ